LLIVISKKSGALSQRQLSGLLSEARRIAANTAKLPD
jgi:hypothetical protein